ncbi:hypothetical protein C2G38_2065039 [Gigaspora rosea]|uniref:Uncharacterized protein n=1 Tax=Gigaspora rosea TaxID=44941 RepID=A0A397VZH3_9GLOM|nr:hypothetical protein C2G38_2065039 [Gigaspora rosea]
MILNIDPKHAGALRCHGFVYFYSLKSYTESLNDLCESLRIEKDKAFALRHGGQVYFTIKH